MQEKPRSLASSGHKNCVVITGASSGLGAALARRYAGPGTLLWLIGRDSKRLDAVLEDCKSLGAQGFAEILDVTDQQATRMLMQRIDNATPIDLLIANAGIANNDPTAPPDIIQRMRRTTIDGVHHTIDPILPRMVERGHGQIALMSSLAGMISQPSAVHYSASRSYVRALGLALRSALSDTGVRVNVICPGFVDTPLTRRNGYDMPFLMTAEKAASVIATYLRRDTGMISFPWQLAWIVKLVALLPSGLQQRLLKRMARADLSFLES